MRRSLYNYSGMAGSVYGGQTGNGSGKGAARKVGLNVRKNYATRVPPVVSSGDRVRAEDISKLFGNQENFNMLKSLLNQSGPGALNNHIK